MYRKHRGAVLLRCVVLGCLCQSVAYAQQYVEPGLIPGAVPYGSFSGHALSQPEFLIDPRFSPPPRSVRIHSQVVAAPALPPATLALMHRRNETLHVEVYDRKQRQAVFRGEIPAGRSIELQLPRDSGGHVHETYQSVDFYGEVVQRRVTRALPIDVRYDVVVHRYQVQSIAIDRTGKSPSVIEDIQFQGQPIGRFTLPEGSRLIDGQVDVYRNAIVAANDGLVAPLQPTTQDDGPGSDPLRRAIEELQPR